MRKKSEYFEKKSGEFTGGTKKLGFGKKPYETSLPWKKKNYYELNNNQQQL